MSEKTRGANRSKILRRTLLTTAAVLIVAALFMAPVAATVSIQNPYTGVTVDSAEITDTTMQILVSYTKDNAMAGMTVTYTLDGESVSVIPITVAYLSDDVTKKKAETYTDDDWNNGKVIANCTSYTATIPNGATDVTLTVDGLTYWSYDPESKKLSITGSGNMPAFSTTSKVAIGGMTYYGNPTSETTTELANKGSRYASFPWHKYQLEITSAEFENTITSIGAHTFRKHTALTSVKFPTSLKMVMNYGVGDCSALMSADLSECTKLSILYEYAFSGMATGSEINVANAEIHSIFHSVDSCVSAGTIVKYAGMIEITDGSWTALVIGEDSCIIVDYSGSDTVVEIPASFTKDGKEYFVKELNQYLFYKNTIIKTITFAEGSKCEKIGKYVFAGYALNDFSSFESIELPESVTYIGEYAFFACGNLKNVPDLHEGLETIGRYAFHTYSSNNLDTVITIPSTVTSIGDNAFRQCRNVYSVVIESPTLSLGSGVFSYANYKNIDLTAVKELTLAEGAVFDMTIRTDGVSSIYVSDATMAEKIYPHVRYEIIGKDMNTDETQKYNCRPACIVVTNGGTVDIAGTVDATTGLIEPTRTDYTFVGWYTDSDCTEKLEGTVESKKIYYAKWAIEAAPTGVSIDADMTCIISGESVTLTASAEHKLAGVNYRYQWFADGEKLGEVSEEATCTVTPQETTVYRCEVQAVDSSSLYPESVSEFASSNDVTVYVLTDDSGSNAVNPTDTEILKNNITGKYADNFNGKTIVYLNLSLMIGGVENHNTKVTFIVPYENILPAENLPDGITYQECEFVVLHLNETNVPPTVEIVPHIKKDSGLEITSTLSPFAIGYSVPEKNQPVDLPTDDKKPDNSGTPQGSVVWLTETPTPTPTETATPTETVPTDVPTTQPTQTEAQSPLSILAVIGGLCAVAALRRK